MSLSVFERECSSKADSAQVLRRLSDLHPNTIDLSLDRVIRLLDKLGRPHCRLPPVVLVAGTNGNGSQIAFLRAIGEALGKKMHVYTSPHLVRFHECVVLGGSMSSEEYLVSCLERAEFVNSGAPITLFEITTAAIFLAFAKSAADFVLLETGTGGQLDATNVVEQPLLTVITPISIDHASYLDNTLPAIAREKAGILKRKIPCVVGRQPYEAMTVIEARAQELDAPLFVFGRDFDVEQRRGRMRFSTVSRALDLPMPALLGHHQMENAATAIAAAMFIYGEELTRKALEDGLTKVVWPARLQWLPPGVLHEHVPDGAEIWLDGGHNPAGAQATASAVKEFGSHKRLHLIWGMVDTEDAIAAIAAFRNLVERVFTVPLSTEPNAYPASALTEIARNEGRRRLQPMAF